MKSRPPPTNVCELRVFLGKIGYYRKFIPDFATVSSPLFLLEEKEETSCGPTTVKDLLTP